MPQDPAHPPAPDDVASQTRIAKQAVALITAQIKPHGIVLFGSLARDEAHADSDIDLLVIWDDEEFASELDKRVFLRRLVRDVEAPIDILVCTREQLQEARKDPRSLTAQIVREGKVLYGQVD